MRERGVGMILLTVGRAAKYTIWQIGSAGPMAAALRTYALSLNAELATENIYVACATVCVKIEPGWSEKIADTYWTMHTERNSPEGIVDYV